MNTSISVHQLSQGRVVSDAAAKRTLYQFAPRLDELCTRLGVRKLSHFHDVTEAASDLRMETRSGLPTRAGAVRDGKWFRPDSGIVTLSPLLDYLHRHPTRFGLVSNRYSQVVAELEDCLKVILQAREKGARFRLSLKLGSGPSEPTAAQVKFHLPSAVETSCSATA